MGASSCDYRIESVQTGVNNTGITFCRIAIYHSNYKFKRPSLTLRNSATVNLEIINDSSAPDSAIVISGKVPDVVYK